MRFDPASSTNVNEITWLQRSDLGGPSAEVWINPPPQRDSDAQPRIDVHSWPAIDAMKSVQGTGLPQIAVDTAAVKHNEEDEEMEPIVLH